MGTKSQTDPLNTHAMARLVLDARDNTEYGMLRTFVRIQWDRSSGSDDNSGSQPRRGQMFAGNGTGNYNNLQTGFFGSEGYIQLGGALFGRTTSSAFVNAPSLQFTTQGPSNGRVNQISYTASLGSGMSLTVAAEDAAELREGYFAYVLANPGGLYDPGQSISRQNLLSPANQAPDAVASFDVSQSWGSLKVAGVLHEVYMPKYNSSVAFTHANMSNNGVDAKLGWALMSGLKVNLPMIAAGDYISVYGAYGVGAMGRTLGNTATDTGNSVPGGAGTGGNASFGMGNATWAGYDATTGENGNPILSKSYSVGGEFKHFFTPTVAAYVGGTFGAVNYGGGNIRTWTSNLVPHNANMWGTALGVIWTPVAGLEINPEVAYRQSNIKSEFGVSNGNKQGVKSDDQWIGRLRVARTF